MTDSDRERKSFRPSYNRRMRRFSKEIPISTDFREKYKDCQLVLVHNFSSCMFTKPVSSYFACTGIITANINVSFWCHDY